jgi:hypothetical protein
MVNDITRFGRLMRILLLIALCRLAASAQPVTFDRDVLPILQKRCQSCHRPGQLAPMSLLTFQDARPWAKAIRTVVASRKMPPWLADPRYGHFANDPSLRQTEIDTIVNWANGGAPEGDARDLQPSIQWPEGGWQDSARRSGFASGVSRCGEGDRRMDLRDRPERL